MTEPTDAEILDAADDFRSQYTHGGTTFDEFDALGFARAVLAKRGTPAPVGVEPIGHLYSSGAGEVVYQASYQDGFWQDCSRERYEYLMKAPKISSLADWTLRILYTAPQPTQPQAGAVPLTDEMASKAGRALSDLYATECGVDKEDNWKVYGSDFIATAKLVLEAVGIKGGQHGTDN